MTNQPPRLTQQTLAQVSNQNDLVNHSMHSAVMAGNGGVEATITQQDFNESLFTIIDEIENEQ